MVASGLSSHNGVGGEWKLWYHFSRNKNHFRILMCHLDSTQKKVGFLLLQLGFLSCEIIRVTTCVGAEFNAMGGSILNQLEGVGETECLPGKGIVFY